jgi:uncharacterized protein (TIGR03435 family)
MQSANDLALLREYAANDSQAAFESLVSRHVGLVYSAALRQVRNPHLAEEITQIVFIILAQKARRISDKTILTGWLFQTTRFAAIAETRNAALRRRREQEAGMESDAQQTAPDPIWEQLAPLLDEAISHLGEKDRAAVLLRFFENKSLAEVGDALGGASEDTARKRVARALAKLRNYFSKRGVALTTAIIAGTLSANSVQAAPVTLAKSVTTIAIAKGAAAGGSTLILIKGALKVMAWTKMKTAIVVGTILILGGGTTMIVVKKARDTSKLEAILQAPYWTSANKLENAIPRLIVRPNQTKKVGGISLPSGKCVWVNGPIRDLIVLAYDFDRPRIILPENVPDGPGAQRYDYLNTLPARQEDALRETLKEKFGLIAHTETQQVDVLLLKIKDSEKFKPQPEIATHRNSGPMSRFGKLSNLLAAFFHKPVLNETGLPYLYSGVLPPGTRVPGQSVEDIIKDSLDQLGLELVPSREPIEMLVVEKTR